MGDSLVSQIEIPEIFLAVITKKAKLLCSEIRKSYGFRDPVVKHVVNKFVARSNVGYEKYGSTLDDERRFKMKDLYGYLTDIQEELMDAVLYIQTAREELEDAKKV